MSQAKPAVAHFTSRYLVFCIGFLIILSYHALIIEAAMRNLAFAGLVDYFLQPVPVASMPPRNSMDLFFNLTKRNPGRYEPYYMRLKGVALSFADAEYIQYAQGRNELQLAQEAQAGGNQEQAEDHYRRALAIGTEQIQMEAHLQLANLFFATGNLFGFEQHLDAVAKHAPPLGFRFDQCPDRELLGGYVDKHDIELDRPVHIVLVWKSLGQLKSQDAPLLVGKSASQSAWQTVFWQNYEFQLGLVDNSVHDGGFERRLLPQVGVLPQLPNRFYRQTPQNTQIIYEYPETVQNMFLMLYGHGEGRVGIGSQSITIPPAPHREAYLITGRYRTHGEAEPRIGINYLLEDGSGFGTNLSWFADQPSRDWSQFAGFWLPPSNAAHLSYWVLNLDSASKLYVDDLGLFSVPVSCVVQ